MVTRVRKRRAGTTRISAKNQVTLPVAALRQAGLKPGDELAVADTGPGRVVLARRRDAILRHAGALTGVYPKDYLKKLRDEWR